ncbi:MAG: efflux transporter periplasmic adaptor subunit [Planctomycetes bacterium B3_Pla]|nr:MAG: efflux transporter periplasmic adaptor subunit [Planctomycetes bacterium B3_Pla]
MKKTGGKLKPIARTAVALAVGFLAGYLVRVLTATHEHGPVAAVVEQPQTAQGQTWWTCSMHPQIRQPKQGKCPLCFMDLIQASSEGGDIGPRQISFSKEATKLMEIDTTAVQRRFVTSEIRMVGKIDYDETRVKHITAWVPGRIDRLYVDFTGIKVEKGDHLVYLYSKELLEDQRALLAAIAGAERIRPDSSDFADRLKSANVEAVRTRLRLRGLTDEQIAEIEKAGEPLTHLTIYSPIGGIVIEKKVTEGMYVNTGTHIYTVADLSKLWVMLDAYESDLSWIRYGQGVEFSTEAYPGEVFKGKISFRDPVLNARTRTVKVRVNVENPNGKLKPEMFVRAVLRAKVAQGGAVMEPDLAGKWICPMHPSIVKAQAGACDICDMDLVTTESLYTAVGEPNEPPLVIPASAPLITGKRAVVYVKVPDKEKPTFEGREVVLGPRAGNYYLVKDGLEEGEVVVTNGNFKIDSALQIQAKPSMMSAKSEREALEVPDEFLGQIWGLVEKYLSLQDKLAGDDKDGAAGAAGQTAEALSAVDMGLVTGQAHDLWMGNSMKMRSALNAIKGAAGIEPMRKAFETLSNELIAVIGQFGVPRTGTLYRINCPMAFDNKGAYWLQMDEDIRNPYFGASMLKCGEVVEVLGEKTK